MCSTSPVQPRVGSSQSRSQLTVILKPWGERESGSINNLMDRVRQEFSRYPESKVYLSTPPTYSGFSGHIRRI